MGYDIEGDIPESARNFRAPMEDPGATRSAMKPVREPMYVPPSMRTDGSGSSIDVKALQALYEEQRKKGVIGPETTLPKPSRVEAPPEPSVQLGAEVFMSDEEAERQARAEAAGGHASDRLPRVNVVGGGREDINAAALREHIAAARRKAEKLGEAQAPKSEVRTDLSPVEKPRKPTFLERLGLKKAA